MSDRSESGRRFALRTAVLAGTVMAAAFMGNRLAMARPGVAGGAARTSVSVAGTLTGVSGTARATFRFYDAMAGGTELCASSVDVAGGAFNVEVPLDGMMATGPRCLTLFDGADVFVDVVVNGQVVVPRRPINPVPYAHYASVAGQYGTPDCPVGYRAESEPGFTGEKLCVRRAADGAVLDQVVRVGRGHGVFWVDRYEAVVATSFDLLGTTVGQSGDDYGSGLQDNGAWTVGRYARSTSLAAGSPPSRYITWFQANTACRLSGKRLPTGDEWLMAAHGTSDPGSNNGSMNTQCNTMSGGPRHPGGGRSCVSVWGAQDMIGNLWEWTAEWYANPGTTDTDYPTSASNGWPTEGNLYVGDGTWNIASSAYSIPEGGMASRRPGIPSATYRGGAWDVGTRGGIFAMDLSHAPSSSRPAVGFRCVLPR